jgi:hypothetical protein
MVTSRPVPQQTAQMVSPLAGQNRAPLRFSQIGQDKMAPSGCSEYRRIRWAENRSKAEGPKSGDLPKLSVNKTVQMLDFFCFTAIRAKC